MKTILSFLSIVLFISISAQAQQSNPSSATADTSTHVTFTTNFVESTMATKDGYYINGYVVSISPEQAAVLNGKKIRVSGTVSIVKGLDNQPKEYDANGNEIYAQGRLADTKHITSPVIVVLDN